jgi:CBS domain-containing protein
MNRVEAKRRRLQSVVEAGEGKRATDLTVEQLMTTSPITVEPGTSALDLVQLFYSLHVRHFPVKGELGQLVGMISDREMVRCFGVGQDPTEEQLAQVTAAQLMNTDLVSVAPGAPVLAAVRTMIQHSVNALPVTHQDRLVGIVTSTDLFVLLEALLKPAAADVTVESEPEVAGALP